MADQNNKALQVTTAIESLLKKKTFEAIQETRKQVAADVFGVNIDAPSDQKIQEEIDLAYESTDQLAEADKSPDVPLAHELKDKALYNHHQFHSGNHDARHGGWAMHDLGQWSKNYSKKKTKGVYDKDKAVKGLTHAIKRSEPSYFGKAHHEKSGQTVSGATRTHAAKLLLPHVEKLMAGKKLDETTTVSKSEDPMGVARVVGLPTKKKLTASSLWKGLGGKKKDGKKPVTAKDLMHEDEVMEGKTPDAPKRNAIMNYRLRDHGFKYQGTKGKFHMYKNDDGHELKHLYPTTNGNHSFKHTDSTGKTVWKSPSASDTEIGEHMKKHFPKTVTEDEINEVLIPGKKLSPDQHKKVLSAFVHRHTGEHTPNWVRTSDDHHTPTHRTDKDWVHDHAFHFNKKTGSLAANRKYAEPHYMADNVKEAEITHKTSMKEAERKDQARPKPEHQAAFNKKWSGATDQEKKLLKKHAWNHGYDIPDWHDTQSKSKSPIHSFAEMQKALKGGN